MAERGLREIKKEATVHALAAAAFELALERGMDGFVIDDIVQRAGYSRRTFANHFSCKEEAVVSVLFAEIDSAVTFLANTPDEMSLLDALHDVVRSQLTAPAYARMRDLMALSRRHPALEPHILAARQRIQEQAPNALVELVQGRYPDQYMRILLGATYGALSPLFDGSVNVVAPGEPPTGEPGAVTLDEYLDTVFDYLRNGF